MTSSLEQVLDQLLREPTAEVVGVTLVVETGLSSGTTYTILHRLEDAGWLEARWEDIDPVAAGRPRRRLYRLTGAGVVSARHDLAAHRDRVARRRRGGRSRYRDVQEA